jgi:TPR repeat protein
MSRHGYCAGLVIVLLGLSQGCSERERLAVMARTGSAAAMRKYGTWICRRGCGGEFQTGIGWLKRAAGKGDRKAMVALAHYAEGLPERQYWFRKGAEAGSRECMITLAKAYEQGGLGLPVDEVEADKWRGAAATAQNDDEL